MEILANIFLMAANLGGTMGGRGVKNDRNVALPKNATARASCNLLTPTSFEILPSKVR